VNRFKTRLIGYMLVFAILAITVLDEKTTLLENVRDILIVTTVLIGAKKNTVSNC
jgi:hypothetical protein